MPEAMRQQMWRQGMALLRSLLPRLHKKISQAMVARWCPYSRLFLVSDSGSWSISWDMHELATIARRLGVYIATVGSPMRGIKLSSMIVVMLFCLTMSSRINRIGWAQPISTVGRELECQNLTRCISDFGLYSPQI